MPLIKRSSKAARATNIRRLIDEGYPPRQAVAIAYSTQRAARARNRAGGSMGAKAHRDAAIEAEKATRAQSGAAAVASSQAASDHARAAEEAAKAADSRTDLRAAAQAHDAAASAAWLVGDSARSERHTNAMDRAWRAATRAVNAAGGKRRNRAGRRSAADRLFIGVFPGGISYADRGRSEHGDYARVAFLPYDTLELKVSHGADPKLVKLASEHAKTIAAKRGQPFSISTAGQTVMLGSNRVGGKRRNRAGGDLYEAIKSAFPSMRTQVRRAYGDVFISERDGGLAGRVNVWQTPAGQVWTASNATIRNRLREAGLGALEASARR